MTWVFSAALFLSAFLLFWVQPLAAKLILPLLGGTPGVWNASMVFFQAVLLGGYVYAHLLGTRLPQKRQLQVHAVILAVAALALPVALPRGWEPTPGASPALWVVMLLGLTVGLPALAISATAPLLQHWFSLGGHETSEDPYYLYAASNAGSIAALLGFPILIEPRLTLSLQGKGWAVGYLGLALLLLFCGVATLRRRPSSAPPAGSRDTDRAVASDGVPWLVRLRWVLLALVPSSLLLGVTTHITTDVAAVPLLWVVPLGIYLLSFVIVFSRRPLLRHRWMLAAQPWAVLALAVVFGLGKASDLVSFPLHLAALFLTAMACHGELAAGRPAARHLTEFYLWMSIGGVLGGMFNALLAPLFFPGVWEYPLVLVLSLALRPLPPSDGRRRLAGLAVTAGVCLAVAGALWGLRTWAALPTFMASRAWLLGGGAVAAWLLARRRPVALALTAGGILLAGVWVIGTPGTVLLRERNFYGVITISREQNAFHVFRHGRIVHGAQMTDPALRGEPLTYFTRQGPLGKVFAGSTDRYRRANVAVIGLGAGTIAAYGQPGQTMTFFEIDPDVIDVARNTRLFTFLSDSRARIGTVAGDARLTLAREPDGAFDLIVIDAFSSDAVPVHIITREAFDLYARKLASGGVIAANVSNAYMDLAPVLVKTANDLGWSVIMQIHTPMSTTEQVMSNRMNSRWVVMARRQEDMGWIPFTGGWTRPVLKDDIRAWTDDYSNILSVLRLPGGKKLFWQN